MDDLRQLLAKAWRYHPQTFDLYLRLSGVRIPCMHSLVQEISCLARATRGSEELRLRKASVDFSNCGLTDEDLQIFLEAWPSFGFSSCGLCLRLQRNRLTGRGFRALGLFCTTAVTLEELHATHQRDVVSRSAILDFLKKLSQCNRYPIWVKRRRCFRPVHLRLGQCGIEDPEAIAKEMENAGARICFADDQGCVRSFCAFARQGSGCPVAHLYDFRNQEQEAELVEPQTPGKRLAELQMEETGDKGKLFLCGSCGNSLPIDMFTRSQFSKASCIDQLREESSHLVRRCNECVTQPCCACGELLPLTAFSGSQMLRPQGSRRCRPCTLDTWWCDRCQKPKPTNKFSSIQARKGKQISKICQDCEETWSNEYFERRQALCAVFSGRYAEPPWRLPCFSREILSCILSFARESKFIRISGMSYSCSLCNKTKSFTSQTAPIERHLRSSKLHLKRLRSLSSGQLFEIAATGLELDRFREGLHLLSAFCSLEQLKEARSLIDARSLEDHVALQPVLRHLSCGRWVSPELLARARELSRGRGDEELAESSMQDVHMAEERARTLKQSKVNMLCHAGESDSDEETMELRRFLAT